MLSTGLHFHVEIHPTGHGAVVGDVRGNYSVVLRSDAR